LDREIEPLRGAKYYFLDDPRTGIGIDPDFQVGLLLRLLLVAARGCGTPI
jgi:hypothetical protein